MIPPLGVDLEVSHPLPPIRVDPWNERTWQFRPKGDRRRLRAEESAVFTRVA